MGLFSRRRSVDGRSGRDGGQEAYDRGMDLFEQERWSEAADEFAKVNEGVRGSWRLTVYALRGGRKTNEPLRVR